MHTGVQPGVLPSQERIFEDPSSRRSHPDTVYMCFLRQVNPEQPGDYSREKLRILNSYAKLVFDLAG